MNGGETPLASDNLFDADPTAQKARQVGESLRRSLPAEEEIRDDLQEIIMEITSLHEQVAEWIELHHLLQKISTSLAPFHAQLVLPRSRKLEAAERQALLRNWRSCQMRVDSLADFAEGIERIGCPFRREGGDLVGERWVVEPVALQTLLESALKEADLSPTALRELADELNDSCQRHLVLIDRKMEAATEKLRRLSTNLLGGLQ